MFNDPHVVYGIIASLVAASVSTLGLLSMAALGDWGRRNSSYFSSFAIGILLVAVFLHLIPEAFHESENAWQWVLAGFFGMTFFALVLRYFAHENRSGSNLAFGYASIIALGFHSFLDGVIYGTTFHSEPFTGVLATSGLLLHEFPEGVIAYFLMVEAGANRTHAVLWAFIAASITTVAGALASALFIENIEGLPFGALLALAAGALIYVMVFHLGPHARFTPKKRGYLLSMTGVAVALAAVILRESSGVGH